MHHEVIVAWLSLLFGLMAVTLAFAAALVSWGVLLVAVPMGATAALLWYHASGRLHERMERRAYRRRATRQRTDAGRAADASVGPTATDGGRRGPGGAPGAGPRGPDGGVRGATAAGSGPGWSRRRGRNAVGGNRAAQRGRRARAGAAGSGATAATQGHDMTRQRALSVLGLDPGADDAAVRAAYRSRVKETHPDSGGDADAFMQVTAAYERLGAER